MLDTPPLGQYRADECLTPLTVDDEELLCGRFRRSLDGKRKGVIADERTIGNEVTAVELLMEVAEAGEVGLLALVPLCDCFVHF